jgi:formylmethanofuran dehydrogenase subunit E
MNIGSYAYEEYIRIVKSFHGNLAPGLVIGGFMVDLAQKNLPEGKFFDAICETPICLPDAIQLLTPCTLGNGWMTVFDFGKFALTLYDKSSGHGIRVYLDVEKLKQWPEVYSWYMKLKPKKEQDFDLLMAQIKEAGDGSLSMQSVRVEPEKMRRPKVGSTAVCSGCGESYPMKDGDRCRPCSGESPYL